MMTMRQVLSGYVICHCELPRNSKEVDTCTCPYKFQNGEKIENPPTWVWSPPHFKNSAALSDGDKTVYFHPGYSTGNACIMGNTPMVRGNHYFWEIKVLKRVYGSSVMIGIGTANVDLGKYSREFRHMLGDDGESWGLSYRGDLHHNNECKFYNVNAGFDIGSIIGVHLDMWSGTLEYYRNREPLGIAYTGLKDFVLYPMISSTAAHICMRLTCTITKPHSLFFTALKCLDYKDFEQLPYRLSKHLNECWWHFPKVLYYVGKETMVENHADPQSSYPIYVVINSDDEDDEENQVLASRMKRVLENSVENEGLRPLPKKHRSDSPTMLLMK